MTTSATIAAELILDSKGFTSGIKDATKQAETFESRMKKVGMTMQNVGKIMTASITIPMALMAKDAVMMASSYDESLNKVNVVFENSAKIIEDWSKGSAQNIGMSQQQALEAAGTFGNLFIAQGMATDSAADMSTALVNLAADLASFNNANPEDVLLALRSGLSGEIEPLKRFGIAMSESVMKTKAMELGLGDNIQALTEAEKIQVRYAIILDQTTKAQGDFARTSDGLANQLRILKANWGDTLRILGKNLLPVVTKVLQMLNKFLEWFNKADPKTQKFVATLLLIAFVAGPLMMIFGKLLPLAFAGATKSLNPFSGGIFGLIGTLLKLLSFAALVVKVLTFFGVATGPAGAAIVGLQAAIAGVGASLFSIIAPLLLIIATVGFVYWAFKNNFMGITDAAKQLGFIIAWVFKNIYASVSTTLAQLWVIAKFGVSVAMAFIMMKVKAVVDFFKKIWTAAKTAFTSVFSGIVGVATRVFAAITKWIMTVINAINKLRAAFASIKLPAALTPGSPTPFEMGLRGINSQMDVLSQKSLPQLRTGFANTSPAGIQSVGQGNNTSIVDNRRFEAGVTADVLKLALRENTIKLAGAIAGS